VNKGKCSLATWLGHGHDLPDPDLFAKQGEKQADLEEDPDTLLQVTQSSQD
jgi:hypothetical protein